MILTGARPARPVQQKFCLSLSLIFCCISITNSYKLLTTSFFQLMFDIINYLALFPQFGVGLWTGEKYFLMLLFAASTWALVGGGLSVGCGLAGGGVSCLGTRNLRIS